MNKKTVIFFATPFLLSFSEGIAVIFINFLTPSEAQSHFLLGLSVQRLLIVGGVFLFSLLFLIIGWILIFGKGWPVQFTASLKEKPGYDRLAWLFFLTGFVFFNLLLVPDYQWGNYLSLVNRLQPILVWGLLIGLQFGLGFLFLLFIPQKKVIHSLLKQKHYVIRLSLIILGIFLTIWAWMAWSGMGIYPDVTFWNVPGVPLLAIQVYVVVLAGAGLFIIEKRLAAGGKPLPKWTDLIICLLIFLSAAVLWNLTPQKSTVFAPGPYAPNEAFYPHSDAAIYNLSAQLALVGSGYNILSECPDKGLYITLLTWLNWMAGLDQKWVIILQVCVIAVLPVLIYLIGKAINNRTLGIMVAFLAIFKETNAIIASAFITTSMSKMMMSELPTAIFIAAMLYCLILWVKTKGQKIYLAGVIGGIIGLATLMRLTMNIFIPLVLVVFCVVLFRQRKRLLLSILFFCVVFASAILPWTIRVQEECHPNKPFYYILGPLQGVIWQGRYNRAEAPVEISPTPTPTPQTTISSDNAGRENSGDTQTSSTDGVESYPIENNNPYGKSKVNPPGKWLTDSLWPLFGQAGDKLEFISGHFFHNFLTTTLIFPTTLIHDDLKHVADPLTSLWSDRNWDGKMSPAGVVFHIMTLGLIALGIAAAWKKWRLAGLIPLLVYFTFCAGLALARTSGGRYIVPIDWILYIYYAGGFVSLFSGLAEIIKPEEPLDENINIPAFYYPSIRSQVISCSLAWLFFFLWGLSIPGTEKVFQPVTFTPPSSSFVREALTKGGYPHEMAMKNDLLVFGGRAVSPRFFFFNQDILPGGAVAFPLQYPRFTFILIGANVPTINVVLPTHEIPMNIPNGAVVSVAGCNTEYGLEAVLIKIGDHIYFRDPQSDRLTCPLPEIKCDPNDRTCH